MAWQYMMHPRRSISEQSQATVPGSRSGCWMCRRSSSTCWSFWRSWSSSCAADGAKRCADVRPATAREAPAASASAGGTPATVFGRPGKASVSCRLGMATAYGSQEKATACGIPEKVTVCGTAAPGASARAAPAGSLLAAGARPGTPLGPWATGCGAAAASDCHDGRPGAGSGRRDPCAVASLARQSQRERPGSARPAGRRPCGRRRTRLRPASRT